MKIQYLNAACWNTIGYLVKKARHKSSNCNINVIIADGFMAMPLSSWSTEFYVMSYTPLFTRNSQYTSKYPHFYVNLDHQAIYDEMMKLLEHFAKYLFIKP